MLWIIQENFKDEYNYENLIEQLKRQGCNYTTVKMIPFGNCTEPDINTDELAFVVGATSLNNVSKEKKWTPGYFDANLNYELLIENYGSHMLNYAGVASTFDDAKPVWDPFFIRPVNDGKQFSGQVMSQEEFVDWRARVVALAVENSWVSLEGTDRVFCAPLTKIYEEYRFQVIAGIVISGSRYKRGNKIGYDSHVDERIKKYAQAMVDIWQPNAAFVIDIAVVPDNEEEPEWSRGLRVIEINAINSAGFYACDMGLFVAAIEDLGKRIALAKAELVFYRLDYDPDLDYLASFNNLKKNKVDK